jgi:hypothetical protein
MKDTEKEYFKSIGQLSDFNTRTGIFAVQASALNGTVYSSMLNGAATVLIDQFKSVSPVASMFPSLDSSIHSQATVFARDANMAICSLTTSACVDNLASVIVSRPTAWMNGISPSASVIHTEGFGHLVGESAHSFVSGIAIPSPNEIRISTPYIDPFKASVLGIESNMARISATSMLAEGALSSFKWNDLGSQIGIHDSAKMVVGNSFVAVSKSYSDIFTAIQAAPQSILENTAFVVRQTPIEYYTGAEFCRAISVLDAPIIEKDLIANDILIDNRFGLESKLPRIDSGLVDMWHGASKALASDNPDRIRHFSTSARELLTHVIHHLSPDKEVKKWSSDPAHYHNGRPTREARLLFISRKINLGGFQGFVQKDVAATVEFINLFHEGTHSVKSSLTENQLLALKSRAESTLNFLIDIAFQES